MFRLLVAALFALPSAGPAQTFKVARFNIGGDGGTDYLTAEPGTGRVFVSRGTHVMVVDGASGKLRSEEHTSELQSRLHLVCRLLLEKKKKPRPYPATPLRYALPCAAPAVLRWGRSPVGLS